MLAGGVPDLPSLLPDPELRLRRSRGTPLPLRLQDRL